MEVRKIDDIYELLKGHTQKKRLVVAYANDSHSIEAVNKAVEMGLVEATLCGDTEVIKQVCAEHGFDVSRFHLVHEPVDTKAAALAVKLVREKEADFIMKGLVSTDKYMRAILNKDCGLLPPKATLSHVVVMECPAYHKLIVFSDAAIIPAPDFSRLQPVAMRLETREGINNSLIVNDAYNSDINSLAIALDYLHNMASGRRTVLILSDILQSGMDDGELYSRVAALVAKSGVCSLVGIGEKISSKRLRLPRRMPQQS